ncbi:MAG: chloride channel protein [Fervidicoccus fontis]
MLPSLVASAVGYTIFGSVIGFSPIFGNYIGSFVPSTFPLYFILGIVDGLIAILYVKIFYFINDSFKNWKANNYLKNPS